MILTDKEEEILERLWIELIEQKKGLCDPETFRDNESLERLDDLGYIKIEEARITLTAKGEGEAKYCVRRHRLAERLFVDVFDIKMKSAHAPSCKFEHLLHKGLDESICTLLGHPKTCPHGKAIPEGNCCNRARVDPKKIIMPLHELDVNKKAKICYLQTKDSSTLQKAIAIGALPNTEISLIQKTPSIVFQVGKSQFAIDTELASHIYVRIL
ncbi:MAG: metal-dependent transcriptional regulator [Candidatus Omnitrophota bacterium]